jgi:hypothetical protein
VVAEWLIAVIALHEGGRLARLPYYCSMPRVMFLQGGGQHAGLPTVYHENATRQRNVLFIGFANALHIIDVGYCGEAMPVPLWLCCTHRQVQFSQWMDYIETHPACAQQVVTV